MSQTSERTFETLVEEVLLQQSGWQLGTNAEWDVERALFPARIFAFLQETQAELYQTTAQNITLHLKAIYQEGELDPQATCKECLQVQGVPGGFPSPKIPAHIG